MHDDACLHPTPDLTPWDIFSMRVDCWWGMGRFLQDAVYRKNPYTIAEIKRYISSVCETIPAVKLVQVYANFVLRLRLVIASIGEYIQNIVI